MFNINSCTTLATLEEIYWSWGRPTVLIRMLVNINTDKNKSEEWQCPALQYTLWIMVWLSSGKRVTFLEDLIRIVPLACNCVCVCPFFCIYMNQKYCTSKPICMLSLFLVLYGLRFLPGTLCPYLTNSLGFDEDEMHTSNWDQIARLMQCIYNDFKC